MTDIRVIVHCRFVVFFLLGVISSASCQGNVPPHIMLPNTHEPRIVDIDERLGYTLGCTAEGHPKPSYQWKRRGIILNNNDFMKTLPNGTLYFKNFTDNENDIYQCMATNKFGTSVSANIPIWNSKPASKESIPTNNVETKTVKAGDSVDISCGNTPETIPKWNKRWYLTEGSIELHPDDRRSTDSEGTLRFAFAKVEDTKSYSCVLVPQRLKDTQNLITYRRTDLQVTTSARNERPIQTQYFSGGGAIKGTKGDDVVLECFFSGNPLPNINWRHNNREITTQDHHKYTVDDWGRRLKISHLDDTDEGEYACEATNGIERREEKIYVNVTSPPVVVPHEGLISKVIPDGRKVILKCHTKASSGENLNSPVWFRNGELLTNANVPDPARYIFNGDYTELHITDTNKDTDTACFQCNVSNSEGYAFSDAYLNVIESIKITKHPDPVNEIHGHQVIDLSVHATGDNCCNLDYAWSLDGARLSPDELGRPPFRQGPGGSLMFDPRNVSAEILASRTGRFQCNISSVYDSATFEFTLSVTAGGTPESFLLANGGFELWWVFLLCVILFVIIIAIIVCVCIRMNYYGETYPLEKTELEHHLNPKEELINCGFKEI
ncbi:hypothetical protein BsWGS_24150 [Bradybaena similaris]